MAFWLRPPVSARTLRRLAVRSLALIAIGVVVFGWWGEGGGLDSLRIPGVLQRIGVAGLIAGVVVAGLRRWWAIAAVTALLLVGYGWTLTSPTVDGCRGVDVPACTVPGSIDAATFGSAHLYRDGAAGYDPEGLPSTAGAVASVLIGWLAGDLLRRRRLPELAGLGGVCFGVGLFWVSRDRGQQAALDALVRARDRRDLHRAVARRTRGRRSTRSRARAAWPIVALGRNALLVYVGQHIVGVWLSRVHVGDVTASDVAARARGAARDRTSGRVPRVCTRHARRVDRHRVRAPCATVVRDAVRRRLCAALVALALCAMAACSGDDGGSASSSVAPSTTTAGGASTTTSTSLSPTTTAVLDVPGARPRRPADRRPSERRAGESPAAEVAPPSSVAPGSTSSVPLAPEFVNPATGGEPPNAVVPPASPDLKIRYIVLPHPDDEFEAWSMVAGDTTHYIVFILLTRGEYSRYCDGSGISELQANRAERYPEPQPFTGAGNA